MAATGYPRNADWDLCYSFKRHGWCGNRNCKWRHPDQRNNTPDRAPTLSTPVQIESSGNPICADFLEEFRADLTKALQTSLRSLQGDGDLDTNQNASALKAQFQEALRELREEPRLAPDRQIHVGLMDYMGEAHESYRRELDFLETTDTWFDTDVPTREQVHWLPAECGWQEPDRYTALGERVKDGFQLLLKVSHVATHLKQLESPEDWWPRLWQEKYSLVATGTAAYLWQFPPSFTFDDLRFARLQGLFNFLARSPEWAGLRHIVDFRHTSWHRQRVYTMLQTHNICLAWLHLQNTGWASNLKSGWTPLVQTADFVFMRLFGNEDRCMGWYDKAFLHRLYQMCPPGIHSYVLFGNKACWADPKPKQTPCFLNARDFRNIFSKVDLVTRVRDLRYRGDCPRLLDAEDTKAVNFFFLRYSQKAREHGVCMDTPVCIVDATKYYADAQGKRSYEWQLPSPLHLSLHDAKEQEDMFPTIRQLQGMEDVNVLAKLCERAGSRQWVSPEAEFANATFLRFSAQACKAGVLHTSRVQTFAPKDGPVFFQWLPVVDARPQANSSVTNPATSSTAPFLTLSIQDLQKSCRQDLWLTFCELQRL